MRPLEENPLLSINLRVWKYFAVILNDGWRVYGFVLPVCVMNAMQFVHLYRIWVNLSQFILNIFFTAAIFNALLRTCLVIKNRNKFEIFMQRLDALYIEIEQRNDKRFARILNKATAASRKISIFNLSASFSDIVGALIVPLISKARIHPFGVAIPFLDMKASPTYELVYLLQIPTPVILTAMYMPFVSLFASYAMFGQAALQCLQLRLMDIGQGPSGSEEDEQLNQLELVECIKFFEKISDYVREFEKLVKYIVSIEFLLFSVVICSLLFCINIIDSVNEIISVIMYIFTMLYVLFTYYWQANELLTESLNVSMAAYSMDWYNRSQRFKKILVLFIVRTQKPLTIMVGNLYPMTLETFQSLLNASYSYFTLLRGLNE